MAGCFGVKYIKYQDHLNYNKPAAVSSPKVALKQQESETKTLRRKSNITIMLMTTDDSKGTSSQSSLAAHTGHEMRRDRC